MGRCQQIAGGLHLEPDEMADRGVVEVLAKKAMQGGLTDMEVLAEMRNGQGMTDILLHVGEDIEQVLGVVGLTG